jgi:hypothetical protein
MVHFFKEMLIVLICSVHNFNFENVDDVVFFRLRCIWMNDFFIQYDRHKRWNGPLDC